MDIENSLPGMNEQEETKDTNFVFVMDNHFTLPKAVDKTWLQGIGIWCVGPSRKERLGTQVICWNQKITGLILSITLTMISASSFSIGWT